METENRNEVNIDLDKYMSLVEKLDSAEDTISASAVFLTIPSMTDV